MSGILPSEYLSYCPRIKFDVSPQWTVSLTITPTLPTLSATLLYFLWGPYSFLAKHVLHFLLFCAVNLGKRNKRWPLLHLNARLSRNFLCQKKKLVHHVWIQPYSSFQYTGRMQPDAARILRFQCDLRHKVPLATCTYLVLIFVAQVETKRIFVRHLKEGVPHVIFMLKDEHLLSR